MICFKFKYFQVGNVWQERFLEGCTLHYLPTDLLYGRLDACALKMWETRSSVGQVAVASSNKLVGFGSREREWMDFRSPCCHRTSVELSCGFFAFQGFDFRWGSR